MAHVTHQLVKDVATCTTMGSTEMAALSVFNSCIAQGVNGLQIDTISLLEEIVFLKIKILTTNGFDQTALLTCGITRLKEAQAFSNA